MEPKKILIVDDDNVTLTLLNRTLSNNGFTVIEAKTGKDAIAKTLEHMPDLIIMDIILPDFDGADAVKQIHEMPSTKGTKVIFLSSIADKRGHETEEISSIKIGNGQYDIFAKPINLRGLLQKIEKNINEA